jgi:hypothetical protein
MVRTVFIIALLCLGVFSQDDDIECACSLNDDTRREMPTCLLTRTRNEAGSVVKTWVGDGTSRSGWWKQVPCPPCSLRPGVICDDDGYIISL